MIDFETNADNENPIIKSITDALHYFLEHCCGYKANPIRQFHGERGPIANIIKCGAQICYVMHKRDWFFAFSRIYKQVDPDDRGIGQSFNMRMLEQAADDDADLVCVMGDGKVYHTRAVEALDYIMKMETFRVPKTEKTIEGSIPRRMLVRMICS